MRPYVEIADVEFSYGEARVMPSGPTANRASSSAVRTRPIRRQAVLEDIDWQSPRGVQSLATCAWIAHHRNLLLIGPTDPTT
jgi:hypothetical protein